RRAENSRFPPPVREVGLIIEAPLSYAFKFESNNGSKKDFAHCNPIYREIETGLNYDSKYPDDNDYRSWTNNGGASSALMAILFLQQLNERLRDDNRATIHLFEGFHTWKKNSSNEKAPTTNHKRDAEDLFKGFRAGYIHTLTHPSDEIYRTALNLLCINGVNADKPPLVVFGRKERFEQFRKRATDR
ncbi:MAG: hypothetical protein ACOYM3_25030, partial [Terrimicrobiaceae bacterium]